MDAYDSLPKVEVPIEISWRTTSVVNGKTQVASQGLVNTVAKIFFGALPAEIADQSGNVKFSEQIWVILIKKSVDFVLPLDFNTVFHLAASNVTYQSQQMHDFLEHYSIYCTVAS